MKVLNNGTPTPLRALLTGILRLIEQTLRPTRIAPVVVNVKGGDNGEEYGEPSEALAQVWRAIYIERVIIGT